MAPKTLKCTKCSRRKPVKRFSNCRNEKAKYRNYRSSWCIPCLWEGVKRWRAENPEKYRKAWRKYMKKNRATIRAKSRLRERYEAMTPEEVSRRRAKLRMWRRLRLERQAKQKASSSRR